MGLPFPSPTTPHHSHAEVFTTYLDFFRSTVIAKVESLPEQERRTSRLPSGWAPIELLVHLRHVERRWLEWGFRGLDVGDPWADERDGHWWADPSVSDADVVADLRRQGETSTAVITGHALATAGARSERWDGAEPATLERICLHLLQEYARHLGQLDVVVELAGGIVGE